VIAVLHGLRHVAMNWPALITAVAAVISVTLVAAGVGVGLQQLLIATRGARVTVLAQLIREWDSPEFQAIRRRAATQLLVHRLRNT
jgi:hypothetical protein